MVCFHPLTAYRSKLPDSSSRKHSITFNPMRARDHERINLSCGQCVGCRLRRSAEWAARCYHEASLYDKNCFITLTYNDQHLPADRSLDVREFQLFMKRLRKKFGPNIRFYHCGEYGEKLRRPHYHACLFNFDFPDKVLWKESNGNNLYVSEALSELWPFGFSTIGDVTFESAAYVARYIMKKINGDLAKDHYEWVDVDGVIHSLKPEYTTMSRRPGIGKGWFDQFHSDVYPSDFVVVNGRKMNPPKFYDRQFELFDPITMEDVKFSREGKALLHIDNNSKERLNIRERVQVSRLQRLVRDAVD